MIRLEIVLASVLILFAAVIFVFPGIPDKVPAWGAITFSALLLLNRYVVAPYKIRRVFRQSPNSRAPYRLAINEQNLRIVLPNSSEELRWEAFQGAHELNAEFLLMYGPRSFVIVPKRAFDRGDLNGFGRCCETSTCYPKASRATGSCFERHRDYRNITHNGCFIGRPTQTEAPVPAAVPQSPSPAGSKAQAPPGTEGRDNNGCYASGRREQTRPSVRGAVPTPAR
jgi:hypothetical protein